jgi:hypothetical protein
VKGADGEVEDESIWITRFVTDGDGRLKIKELEQFIDSKIQVDVFAAAAAAKAK